MKAACRLYKMDKQTLMSGRQHVKVRMRQIISFVARDVTLDSYPQIGRAMDRDHTTVLHYVKMATRRMSEEAQFATDVYRLARATQALAEEEITNILQWDPPTCYNASEGKEGEHGER